MSPLPSEISTILPRELFKLFLVLTAENTRNLEEMIDYFSEKMAVTNTKLLWGTANLFSNRRYMSGAATNPDPDVFAFSAATIKTCLDATHKLGGQNYVLWGGREGYFNQMRASLTSSLTRKNSNSSTSTHEDGGLGDTTRSSCNGNAFREKMKASMSYKQDPLVYNFGSDDEDS